MAQEIELKFDVPYAKLARLKRAPWLTKHSCGAAEEHKLVSVYYDTDDLELRDMHAMLRVRDTGGVFVQTFKMAKASSGSARASWNGNARSRTNDCRSTTHQNARPVASI